ncbi:MAG: exonuclease SbcCD subunit D [Lachnospiraceae bacterium]|nr:exonuclease SbcCD subunit D [Lachnospiraceae bacterium]
MKIMHLADLHIGKTLGDFELYEDQEYILSQILEKIKENAVDAVLIAGDVYDKSVPSEKAVELLNEFIKKLAEQKVHTYLISGNHDSDERLDFGSSLFDTCGIHISSKFEGGMKEYTLEDEFGEVHFYLLPFVKASQVRYYYPNAKIESYDDAVRAVIADSQIDRTKRNVLVAHQFVAGKSDCDPELAGSEGVAAQTVGLVEKISYSSMQDFDYVALGHIHSPQTVGSEHIRYAGSPLKYSLSEVNNHKSVPLITLGEKKGDNYEPEIELIPLIPMRDVKHHEGTKDELLAKQNEWNKDDFFYFTLTDEEIVKNAMGIFQQTYPHTVKIDYHNSQTKSLEQIQVFDYTEHKSFDELIGEFYKLAYDREMNEDERELMRLVAGEAGVTNEAD